MALRGEIVAGGPVDGRRSEVVWTQRKLLGAAASQLWKWTSHEAAQRRVSGCVAFRALAKGACSDHDIGEV